MAKRPAKSPAKPKAAGRPAKAKAVDVIEPEIVESDDKPAFDSDDELRAELDAVDSPEIDPDREIVDAAPAKRPRRKAGKAVTPEIVDSKALTTTDPVSLYLASIRKYPLLTKEQEYELAIKYRETGDPRAAEQLVTSNLRFVVKVAAEYSRFGAKLIDLVQEGNVGLMHAVREFNPYKGVRLITYAVWWIRGYIQEYLMRQYSMVRIGTTQNQRKLFYRLQKEREALEAMGGSSVKLLAGRLGVSEEEVETMSRRLSGRDVSLSTPVDGDSSSTTLLDFEATDAPGADETIGHLEEMQVLRENLEKIRPQLNEKETYLLEKRLLADEPLTLQEIGDHYGTTREAVRQMEVRVLGKLRAAMSESLGGLGEESAED